MKKSKISKIIILVLSSIMLFSGCKNSDEDYKEFAKNLQNKDYVFALDIYNQNKNDEEFKTKSDNLILSQLDSINSDLNNDNIDNAKKYSDFASKTVGKDKAENLDFNIKKYEENNAKKTSSNGNDNDVIVNNSSANKANEYNQNKAESIDLTKPFTYKAYTNERYGYSINYPDFLTQKTYPENGSGVILYSEDGTVELSLGAINNVLNYTVENNYNDYVSKAEGITYKYCNKSMFVVSGVKSNGTSYYHYEAVGKGSINEFTFTWPSKETNYQAVADELYKSFKTPNVGQSW